MEQIDPEAAFTGAFNGEKGWEWVSNVIGGGASFGILTSLMVAMLGQARYMCVIGRSNVVPAWFARIHPKTSTPVNASAFLGTCCFLFLFSLFLSLSVFLFLVYFRTYFFHVLMYMYALLVFVLFLCLCFISTYILFCLLKFAIYTNWIESSINTT